MSNDPMSFPVRPAVTVPHDAAIEPPEGYVAPRPLILVDIDLTIGCGYSAPCCEVRPGFKLTLSTLYSLGYELRLWSGGGADHARQWAEHGGLTPVISGCHDKCEYPMQPEDVIETFGRLPVLTFDDDESERIEGVPLMVVAPYYGSHRHKAQFSRAAEAGQ